MEWEITQGTSGDPEWPVTLRRYADGEWTVADHFRTPEDAQRYADARDAGEL